VKPLREFPDPFLREIAGPPKAMVRASEALAGRSGTLEEVHDAAGRGGAAVFTGMGSSYDVCYPAVNELVGRGVPALHLDAAELLHFRLPLLRSAPSWSS
jgi:glucosamine--fructose-6-phosphate aminotransferase (isomerizing)